MDDKKKNKLFILIFSLAAFLLPTIVGLILTLIMQRMVFLEAFYIIFGVITLLVALHRSRRRDTKNYKANHTMVEDKEKEEFKDYRKTQILLYCLGVFLLLCSLGAFLLGKYVFGI